MTRPSVLCCVRLCLALAQFGCAQNHPATVDKQPTNVNGDTGEGEDGSATAAQPGEASASGDAAVTMGGKPASGGSSTTKPKDASSAVAPADPDAEAARGTSDAAMSTTMGSTASSGPVEPILPTAPATCPTLKTGYVTIMSKGKSIPVQVWAGTKGDTPAPMVIYWHATGTNSAEAVGGIGMPQAVATEITKAGGIIVSPNASTGAGNDTGNSVWFTGDFDVADQLVACAFQQYNLDPRRIYTSGGSAGALQAGTMVYERSNYLAASLPNSGGYATGGRLFQNPNHITPVMTMHGAKGRDVVVVDFSQQSLFLAADVAVHGGFAIDCDHGGGHVGAGADVKTAGWQFFKDHPFGVSPEPYAAGLPASFPKYCKIVTAADAIPNPDPLDKPDAGY